MFKSVRNSVLHDETTAILFVTLAVLTGLLLIGLLAFALRLSKLDRRIEALTRGSDSRNLEQTLIDHMNTVDQTVRRMEVLEQAVATLQTQLPGCLQRISMVRYDAFDDVGGAQSFSVALLDARGDGVVVTSVYGRTDARVYAKEIRGGRASHPLSREEEHALKSSG